MSGGKVSRSCLEIMNELLGITREMAGSEDADFIIASIDRRGRLMEEYDRVKAASPESVRKDRPEIDRVKAEIIELDKEVNHTLQKLHSLAKDELKSSNAQKRVLGYTKQAQSSSGSYMDYKK